MYMLAALCYLLCFNVVLGHRQHPSFSLGNGERFDLASLKSSECIMDTNIVMYQNFTSLPPSVSIVTFDVPNERAYIETTATGTKQYILSNGTFTYIAPYNLCYYLEEGGTFTEFVDSYSGLVNTNNRGKKHHHHKTEKEFTGVIYVTSHLHGVQITVEYDKDDRGLIKTMSTTGLPIPEQLLGGVYQVAYVQKDCTSLIDFPVLPMACITNPLPYSYLFAGN